LETDIARAAEWLGNSAFNIALTGAGISVDSGIPDFRSPGGLWEKFNPMEYATIQAFQSHPEKVWTMLVEMEEILRRAQPNPGHNGLAELEEMGLLAAVITQNVDNLHQEAGNKVVVEYHGNGKRLVCLNCSSAYDAEAFSVRSTEDEGFPPRCGKCNAVLKPDVILFGETIPQQAAVQSYHLASRCKIILVVGTSAQVYPAAELPHVAKSNGAKIIEVNRMETNLTPMADLSLRGSSSEFLPALVEAVREKK